MLLNITNTNSNPKFLNEQFLYQTSKNTKIRKDHVHTVRIPLKVFKRECLELLLMRLLMGPCSISLRKVS